MMKPIALVLLSVLALTGCNDDPLNKPLSETSSPSVANKFIYISRQGVKVFKCNFVTMEGKNSSYTCLADGTEIDAKNSKYKR